MLLCEIVEDATYPVGVAGLGAIGIVASTDAGAQQLQGGERIDAPISVNDRARRLTMPVGAIEEVDEVDAECLLRLLDLPILPTRALEVLAGPAYSIGERFVCGRLTMELANRAHDEWCGIRAHQKSGAYAAYVSCRIPAAVLAGSPTTFGAWCPQGCGGQWRPTGWRVVDAGPARETEFSEGRFPAIRC